MTPCENDIALGRNLLLTTTTAPAPGVNRLAPRLSIAYGGLPVLRLSATVEGARSRDDFEPRDEPVFTARDWTSIGQQKDATSDEDPLNERRTPACS